MKKLIVLFLIFAIIACIWEISFAIGLKEYKPVVTISSSNNKLNISWSKINDYPAYYVVEILNKMPIDKSSSDNNQLIASYKTWQNNITLAETFPLQTYWRVAAHGFFYYPLGSYSDCFNLAEILKATPEYSSNLKPAAVSYYPPVTPTSDKPLLVWTTIPGAVSYEIEILSSPPENPNNIAPSQYLILSSNEIFTNGFNVDLSECPFNEIYWRIRALDYNKNPLGVFSDTYKLYIDHSIPNDIKPLINTGFDSNMPPLLYPVYSWIPIANATSYEIEVTNLPPENPNGTEPSVHRIWSKIVFDTNDCYDEEPRILPGTYYWRVRGIDSKGNPVGVYSDAAQFTVDLTKGSYAATFGDSITHGGGGISYSPANVEYNFQTYLNFPTVNLGKSGDTSQSMLERFDRDVLPFKPKYLIIMGGTNSLRGGVPAVQVIKELAAIRDKCTLHGIRPIFLTLPPINPDAIYAAFNEETSPSWKENFNQVNNFIRQQKYFIDIAPYFTDPNGELPTYYAIDGLHQDIEGKKLIAHLINSNWSKVTR